MVDWSLAFVLACALTEGCTSPISILAYFPPPAEGWARMWKDPLAVVALLALYAGVLSIFGQLLNLRGEQVMWPWAVAGTAVAVLSGGMVLLLARRRNT